MLGNILLPRLAVYTSRVCDTLGISTAATEVSGGRYDLPTWEDDDLKKRYVVLVPQSILSDVPVALDRSRIEYVASRNAANKAIGADWRRRVTETSPAMKKTTRDAFLSNIPFFEHYQKRNPIAYDFRTDPKALRLVRDALSSTRDDMISLSLVEPRSKSQILEVVRTIVSHFKKLVEENRLDKVFYIDRQPRREAIVQAVFQAVASAHCKYNNLDLSPEVDSGRGPVDFKFSDGQRARVLVELKLSNSTQLIHGFERQLAAYEAAEDTDLSIYLVIDNGFGSASLSRLAARVVEAAVMSKRAPEVVVVDAKPKPSGSKA